MSSLPAEQFKEIIRSLRSDGQGRRSLEKRTGPRVGLRARLSLRIHRAGVLSKNSILVWLRDLSVEGIGLVHSQPLEDGDEFLAEFPLRNQQNLNVLYRVVHCKMLSKNLFCIGARLVRMLDEPN
jgi:hypothetical protein